MALRLLVTRPQPQADSWVERLRAQGVDAQALPLLAIDAVADTGALQAAWHDLKRLCAGDVREPERGQPLLRRQARDIHRIRLASGHPRCGHRARHPAGPAQRRRTAGAVRRTAARRRAVRLHGAVGATARRDLDRSRRAVLRGDGGRDEFAAHLRQAGASVHFVQAYRRGPASLGAAERRLLDAALAQPQRHVWWLSSAEAVGYLPQFAPGADWRAARALASHPRIAARARDIGFGHVFEAPQPRRRARQPAAHRGLPTIVATLNAPASSDAVPMLPGGVRPRMWLAIAACHRPADAGCAGSGLDDAAATSRPSNRNWVRRQTDSQAQAAEARVAARAAQIWRAMPRRRLHCSKRGLPRPRCSARRSKNCCSRCLARGDENVVADVEAAVRVALQQSAITGSVEPLVATLKQADERSPVTTSRGWNACAAR